MTDNRTNELTEAQVEAAAREWYEQANGYETWASASGKHQQVVKVRAAKALVAAQDAAPQAESTQPWNDQADPNSPRFDSPWDKAAALLSTLRGAQFDLLTRRDPVEVQDEVNGLINRLDELVATMLAAPVQPSSTVDDAAHDAEVAARQIDAPSVREAIGEVLADMEATAEGTHIASSLALLQEITDAAIRAAVSPPSRTAKRTAKRTGYETVGHGVGEHSQKIAARAAEYRKGKSDE